MEHLQETLHINDCDPELLEPDLGDSKGDFLPNSDLACCAGDLGQLHRCSLQALASMPHL